MKANFSLTAVQNGARRILMGLVVAVVIFLQHNAAAIPTVDLGTAGNFAVLAGTTITVAGAVSSTTITGDIGVNPGSAVTGSGNIVFTGGSVDQTGNAGLMTTAKFDLVTAYLNAAGRLGATPVGTELGGTTLVSGVYSSGTFGITAGAGALILDGQGNPNAVWVFKADSTLITGSASKVSLINGADACNVFWQIGSSATLGTGSLFVGNLLALTSITVTRGVTVDGRVLARNGAVTLDTDTIAIDTDCIPAPGGGGPGGTAVPDSGSTLLLLSSVFATLVPLRRHFLPRLNS